MKLGERKAVIKIGARAKCGECGEPAVYAANYIRPGTPHKGGWASDHVDFQCEEHKSYAPIQDMEWNSTMKFSKRFEHMFVIVEEIPV